MISKLALAGAALLLLFVSRPVAGQGPEDKTDKVQPLIRKGDERYALRSTDRITWEAIGYYAEALKLDPRSYEALWKLGRAYFWLSDNTEDGATDKDLGWKGYYYAEQAAKLQPAKVEGHYWAAMCIGEHSKGIGIITALRKGIEGTFRRHLDSAARIRRSYEGWGADQAYGNYYYLLPWPKKDNDKALDHLRRSLKANPKNARTHYYLAEVLLDEGKKDESREHIETCLKMDPRQGNAQDNYRYKWHCRRLKKKLQE